MAITKKQLLFPLAILGAILAAIGIRRRRAAQS
jgi:hypothetical protein